MSLTEDLALLSHQLGHGVYIPGDSTSTIFLGQLPAEPAEPEAAIAITPYPGLPGNAHIGHDQPRVQYAVRGGHDSRDPETLAQRIYDDLVGLRRHTLTSGAQLVLCHPVQSGPIWMPTEDRGRTRFVVNLALHLHRPTVHRL